VAGQPVARRRAQLSWPGRGQHVIFRADGWGWEPPGVEPPAASLRPLEQVGEPDHPPDAGGLTGNLLIHGDNLAAMRALLRQSAGAFSLVYLDPPYNTGGRSGPYTDDFPHEAWLSMMDGRLALLHELLADQGLLVLHISVHELHYVKLLCDAHFGRERLVAQISWQRGPDRTVLGQGMSLIGDHVEYLLVYARGRVPRDLPRPQRQGPIPVRTLCTYGRLLQLGPARRVIDEFTDRQGQRVVIAEVPEHRMTAMPRRTLEEIADRGLPPELVPRYPEMCRLTNQQSESTFQQRLLARMPDRERLYQVSYVQPRGKHQGPRQRLYLGGNVVLFLSDSTVLLPPAAGSGSPNHRIERKSDLNNFWTADELPATGLADEGGISLRRGKKPERLLARVVEAFSRPGDRVLDPFAGSGTTAAVAHKLGRRWVTIEADPGMLGLARQRLSRVVEGSDLSGISRSAGWRGGGGFTVAVVDGASAEVEPDADRSAGGQG
jgi:adenine-specific DNA-methyltransferase